VTPTEMADEEVKNIFYDALEGTSDSLPNHCDKTIMGDLNSQIEQEETYKPVVGKHSLHEKSNYNIPRKNIVQYTQRPKRNKWFNERCRKGIQEHNNARIKAIQIPTPENIREFEIKRKKVIKLRRKEKRMSEKARIEENLSTG